MHLIFNPDHGAFHSFKGRIGFLLKQQYFVRIAKICSKSFARFKKKELYLDFDSLAILSVTALASFSAKNVSQASDAQVFNMLPIQVLFQNQCPLLLFHDEFVQYAFKISTFNINVSFTEKKLHESLKFS